MLHTRVVLSFLKALTLLAPMALATPVAAQMADVECDPNRAGFTGCIATTTGMPLRLLVKPGARVFIDMDENSAIVSDAIDPFSVLVAFEQFDVNYDDSFNPVGWFQVGNDVSQPDGYVKAADVVPWKLALALSYTNPGPSERMPVLMFGNGDSMKSTLDEIQNGTVTPDGVYAEVNDAVAAKTPAPRDVVSMEPSGWVDIKEQFYLLPILQFERLDAIQEDLLGIQVAALTNQAVSQQSNACNLQTSMGGTCLADQGAGMVDSLALDVVFVIDTTNSMQPHIDAVTNAINEASQVLAQKLADASLLKFGVVAYRDAIESTPELEYTTKNFTPELLPAEEFSALLGSGEVKAADAGSGDWEEDVFAGMRDGINANWSPQSARIIILIGDASGHQLGNNKNTTGLTEVAIKELSEQNSVYVATIYVAGANDSDLALARPQFENMAAGDAEGGALAFSIVQADGTAATTVEGGSSSSLEESLRAALGNIIEVLSTGNMQSVLSASVDPADTAAGGINTAVRAALVDYLGDSTTVPSNIQAWVLDHDLIKRDVPSFEVRLMLTRAEVEELSAALEQILGKFREGQSTGGSFIQAVQVGSTATSYDLKISDTEDLIDSPLVPLWIKNLPYKSEVLTMSVEEFRAASAEDRTRFEDNLSKLIALYDDIMSRPEQWVALNANASIEESVYMLGLEELP